ncbi:hypothetical protein BGZ81_004037, partial [Podila clonocystis]
IGGVDQPSIRRQVNGFGSGVKISCSTCQAYGIYSGTFEQDLKLSTTVSRLLIDKKVSVVFNAASIFGTMTLKNMTTQQDPAQSAIKLAPAHEATGVYTAEIQNKMQGYIADMAKGKLKTGVDHKSGDSRNSGASSSSVELLSLNGASSSGGSGDRNSTTVDGSPKDSHSGGSALFHDGGVTWVGTVLGFVVVQAMFAAGL